MKIVVDNETVLDREYHEQQSNSDPYHRNPRRVKLSNHTRKESWRQFGRNHSISTITDVAGDAGAVSVRVNGPVSLAGQAAGIKSLTLGDGDAGSVSLVGTDVLVDGARITSQAPPAAGGGAGACGAVGAGSRRGCGATAAGAAARAGGPAAVAPGGAAS